MQDEFCSSNNYNILGVPIVHIPQEKVRTVLPCEFVLAPDLSYPQKSNSFLIIGTWLCYEIKTIQTYQSI